MSDTQESGWLERWRWVIFWVALAVVVLGSVAAVIALNWTFDGWPGSGLVETRAVALTLRT